MAIHKRYPNTKTGRRSASILKNSYKKRGYRRSNTFVKGKHIYVRAVA